MKETGIPVVRKEQGTGKNKGTTIYSPVIFPNKEEAEKFAIAITRTTEESGKKVFPANAE